MFVPAEFEHHLLTDRSDHRKSKLLLFIPTTRDVLPKLCGLHLLFSFSFLFLFVCLFVFFVLNLKFCICLFVEELNNFTVLR